jgi:folate-dependent phosphoribosylglycinamide formyltransferase PurN
VSVRIAILTSEDAPGLDALLLDPSRGPIYDVTTVISAGRLFDRSERLASHGIRFVSQPAPPRNLRDREQYDQDLRNIVGDADFLFLDDYRYLVTAPLLDAFRGRIIVFHDGDLSETSQGHRRYTGMHSVRTALLAGQSHTRASAFVATEDVGEGPLLLLGPPYPVSDLVASALGRADLGDLELYAVLHRRWMVSDSYGVLLRKAAELLSLGTMHVTHDTVWVDGVPGPCRLGDAPAACWSADSPPRRGIPSSCPFIQTEVEI